MTQRNEQPKQASREERTDSALAFLPQRELRLFAIAASLLAHLAVALVLALLILDPPPASIGGGGNDVALATVADAELQSSFDEVELAADVPDALTDPDDDQPQFDDLLAVDDADLSTLRSGEVSSLGGAGESIGEGVTGSGAGGVASFFGVEARGNRFAFVVDISGSMQFDARLPLLKNELREAISGLLEYTHFSVWAFNSQAYPITGVRWVDATDSAKGRADSSIRAMQASGTTAPEDALRQVFELRPRPDAIYFMTDGDFDGGGPSIATLIRDLNDAGFRRIPVYCLTLVDRSGEQVMRQIAQESGGTYRHVSGFTP
ncbi:MAG: VWA domain-containing protein [Planctomycetota bacterium]